MTYARSVFSRVMMALAQFTCTISDALYCCRMRFV